MSTRFSLGIDLGTSNSAIALEDFESGRNQIVEITQILGLGQIGEKPTLPSALYIPHPDEFPQNGMQLPWSKGGSGEPIIGHFARDHGALVPDRLITSAKSWLSNFHIDPKKPVLPWKSDIKEQKLSAFECSRRYLEHIREAFLYVESTQGHSLEPCGRSSGANRSGLLRRNCAKSDSRRSRSRWLRQSRPARRTARRHFMRGQRKPAAAGVPRSVAAISSWSAMLEEAPPISA